MLAVIYLVFTEGYVATEGPALVRIDLCEEAIRLGRTLDEAGRGAAGRQGAAGADGAAARPPSESRRRRRPTGPAPDQDRRQWHHDEIAEGLRLLNTAIRRRSDDPAAERLADRYRLEALIAAAHATAPTAAATDWAAIAALYAELDELTGSPVVRINRAVAVAEVDGPAVALALLDGLDDVLGRSKDLAIVRGERLARLGRTTRRSQRWARRSVLRPTTPSAPICRLGSMYCSAAADQVLGRLCQTDDPHELDRLTQPGRSVAWPVSCPPCCGCRRCSCGPCARTPPMPSCPAIG